MTGRTEPVAKQPEPSAKEDSAYIPESPHSNNQQIIPITEKSLAEAWTKFADTIKTQDARLYSILTAHTPSLEGEAKIIFQINNLLQKEPLQNIQPKLLQYLRTALTNEKIEIEIVLTEKIESAKAYTAEEKFAQMSRKNPALLTLTQQFSLDFE